jgi:hypothetical protein
MTSSSLASGYSLSTASGSLSRPTCSVQGGRKVWLLAFALGVIWLTWISLEVFL